jgi:hypothetical protein
LFYELKKKPRIPARVVLNNRTLTVFENDKYESVLFTTNLDTLTAEDLPSDPNTCFTGNIMFQHFQSH